MLCPACAEPLFGLVAGNSPSIFSPCGHTLCGFCVDAVSLAGSVCPVCSASIETTTPNAIPGLRCMFTRCPDGTAARVAPVGQRTICSVGGYAAPVCDGVTACPEPAVANHVYCHRHPGNPAVRFCEQDSMVLCEDCAAAHGGHVTWPLTPCALPLLRKALDTALLPLRDEGSGVRVLEAAAVAVRGAKARLSRAREDALAVVAREFEELRAIITESEARLVRDVRASFKARTKELEAQESELEVNAAQMDSTRRAGVAALNGGSALVCARTLEVLAKTPRLFASVPVVKTSVNIAVRTNAAAVRKLLEEYGVEMADPVVQCTLACEAFVRGLPASAATASDLCQACAPHFADPSVALVFCWAMAGVNFAESNRTCACSRGAVVRALIGVFTAIAPENASTHLHVEWCRALSTMDANMAPVFVRLGGIQILVAVMRVSAASAPVQQWGAAVVSAVVNAFTCQESHKSTYDETFQHLLRALETHRAAPEMVASVLVALEPAFSHARVSVELRGLGTIAKVVNAMLANPGHEGVQTAGAYLLAEVGGIPGGSGMVVTAGGIEALVKAVETCPPTAIDVFLECGGALEVLFLCEPTVGTSRVLDCLHAALETFARADPTPSGSILALRFKDGFARMRARLAPADAGLEIHFIPRLCAQLGSGDEAEVMCALGLLASGLYSHITAVADGIGPDEMRARLCAAMDAHPTSVGIQARGCHALHTHLDRLYPSPPGPVVNRELECVFTAMDTYGSSPMVQQRGCEFLGDVFKNTTCTRAELLERGGVGRILRAIVLHPIPLVVTAACESLRRVCCQRDVPEYRLAVLNSEWFEQLCVGAEKTLWNERSARRALDALGTICEGPETPLLADKYVRAAQLMLVGLDMHVRSADVVTTILGLLEDMCKAPSVRALLRRMAVPKIQAVLDRLDGGQLDDNVSRRGYYHSDGLRERAEWLMVELS